MHDGLLIHWLDTHTCTDAIFLSFESIIYSYVIIDLILNILHFLLQLLLNAYELLKNRTFLNFW